MMEYMEHQRRNEERRARREVASGGYVDAVRKPPDRGLLMHSGPPLETPISGQHICAFILPIILLSTVLSYWNRVDGVLYEVVAL